MQAKNIFRGHNFYDAKTENQVPYFLQDTVVVRLLVATTDNKLCYCRLVYKETRNDIRSDKSVVTKLAGNNPTPRLLRPFHQF